MSTFRRLLAALSPGRHPLDAQTKALNAFLLMRKPQPPSADENADPRELLAQAQDLCRMAAHRDVKADRRQPQEPVMAEEGSSVLLSSAMEILIEKVYPLASSLRDALWHGPRLPDDILPRLYQHPSYNPNSNHVPEDLYSAEDIRLWLSDSATPFVEGLHAFRFNINRHIYISVEKLNVSNASTEQIASHIFSTMRYPLGFVAREYGWSRALEFFDTLWAYGWIPDDDTFISIRHALTNLLVYANENPHPTRVNEALAALTRELLTNVQNVRDDQRLLPALAMMQQRVDTDLSQLRNHSRSLTEWLRGLHALLPRTTIFAHLLRALAKRAEPASSPAQTFQKQYRFYEEIRADILGCIEAQCVDVPHVICDEVYTQPTRRDAKRALKFYAHGRVFIPLFLVPDLEKIIDSVPSWPLAADDLTLHERFADRMQAGIAGGFAQAYEAFHPEERQGQYLAGEKKWRQIRASPDYKALHDIARAAAHIFYLASNMREEGLYRSKPLPGLTLMLESNHQGSIHSEMKSSIDEQMRIHIALRVLQRGIDDVPQPEVPNSLLEESFGAEIVPAISAYNTHAAAEAFMALMQGVALAVQHRYSTDGFKAVTIEWEGLPMQVVLELEGLRVSSFIPALASGTPTTTVGMLAVTIKLMETLKSRADSLLWPKTKLIIVS